MTIAKKPGLRTVVTDADIERVLNKGLVSAEATTPTAATEDATPTPGVAKVHPLRFPPDGVLYNRLEKALGRATVKLPRNTFILQAIAEKLERETSE